MPPTCHQHAITTPLLCPTIACAAAPSQLPITPSSSIAGRGDDSDDNRSTTSRQSDASSRSDFFLGGLTHGWTVVSFQQEFLNRRRGIQYNMLVIIIKGHRFSGWSPNNQSTQDTGQYTFSYRVITLLLLNLQFLSCWRLDLGNTCRCKKEYVTNCQWLVGTRDQTHN